MHYNKYIMALGLGFGLLGTEAAFGCVDNKEQGEELAKLKEKFESSQQEREALADKIKELEDNPPVGPAGVGITTAQAQEIKDNTLKVGITPTQAQEIKNNTKKVGITPTQAQEIKDNTKKKGITPTQAQTIMNHTTMIDLFHPPPVPQVNPLPK